MKQRIQSEDVCHRNIHKKLQQEKHSHLFNGLRWDDGDRHPHCSRADHHRFSCGILSIISYHREASMFTLPDKRSLVTCLYGAGAGTTGLSCAARCCCCDEADVVEPASWNLNLLHIRLGQWDDCFELRATDPSHSHRLHWFKILKRFR